MGQVRVFWSEDEYMLIVRNLFEQGFKTADYADAMHAVKQIQNDVLPTERQRNIHNIWNIKKVDEMLKEYVKEQKKHHHAAPLQTVPVTELPDKPLPTPKVEPEVNSSLAAELREAALEAEAAPAPVREDDSVKHLVGVLAELKLGMHNLAVGMSEMRVSIAALAQGQPVGVPKHAPTDSMDLIIEALAGALAERFVASLRAALSGVADKEVAQFLGATEQKPAEKVEVPQEAAPSKTVTQGDTTPPMVPADWHREKVAITGTIGGERVKKPRVLILGVLGEQEQMIRNEYKHKFDLKFISGDASSGSVKHKAESVDFIVATRFVGNTVEGMFRKDPRYVRIDGGMTTLRNKLSSLKTGT